MAKERLAEEVIKAVRDIMVTYYESCATNPVMAVSGGMLPYVLLEPFYPEAEIPKAIVAAVGGAESIPHIQIFGGLFSIAPARTESPWPKYFINLKGDVAKILTSATSLKALAGGGP